MNSFENVSPKWYKKKVSFRNGFGLCSIVTLLVLLYIIFCTYYNSGLDNIGSLNFRLDLLNAHYDRFHRAFKHFRSLTNKQTIENRNNNHIGNIGKIKERKLPQVLIIGVRKAGTRALLKSLNMHRQLKASSREVHFFDKNDNYERGIEWYRQQMPLSKKHQIVLEKTPAYFTSKEAPERVYRFERNMKLILIVRNPVVRCVSDFTQIRLKLIRAGKRPNSFQKSIFDADGDLDLSFYPLRNSLYSLHLRHWLKYFPLELIHIVDGDNFVSDPLAELKAIERFLGLRSELNASQFEYDEKKKFYCFRPKPFSDLKCLNKSKGRRHIRIDKSILDRLRHKFKNYNEDFFRLAKRNFTW